MVLGTEQLHNFSSRCLMPGALHWSSDSAERHNINSLKGRSSGLKGWKWERSNMSNTFRSDQIYNLWLEGNIWNNILTTMMVRMPCIVEWRVIFWAVLTRNSDSRCCRPGININLNLYKSMKTKNPAPSSSPKETKASWWFQPIWKMRVKLGSSSPIFGMNKQTYLKPLPPKHHFFWGNKISENPNFYFQDSSPKILLQS